ncbi:MAG TPA: 16S rRNA (cytosine(1402)-N(4))-methyltransferase RsmH [Candidatus Saccharimonadales bacterium]|nr:16S rRNA (cytosine(1402)-N(4))-methyltransferase RsmH [Candidatus Saccharimonadales bacterium]
MERVTKSHHQGVLIAEVIQLISPTKEGVYLDATFGGGGHGRALLGTGGQVIGLDLDPTAEEFGRELEREAKGKFTFRRLSYDRAAELDAMFDGAILDLGLSSDQLEQSGRGFSFQKDEILDLRFNPDYGQTAAQLLGQASLPRLDQIFRDYAEDRYHKALAAKIVETRRRQPIRTTKDLIALVGTDNPKVLAPIWQGLRIAVNDELGTLERGLKEISGCLKKDAVLAVISFHSLEDAIVKKFFRDNVDLEVVTKKPIQPSNEEIRSNPRARSAKLRVARRVTN